MDHERKTRLNAAVDEWFRTSEDQKGEVNHLWSFN
jgi:hypothetical protein